MLKSKFFRKNFFIPPAVAPRFVKNFVKNHGTAVWLFHVERPRSGRRCQIRRGNSDGNPRDTPLP